MEDKWFAIVGMTIIISMVAAACIPLGIEKWQEGELEKVKIQLEIEQLRASGNVENE